MSAAITLRISATINNEYDTRCPEHLPLDKLAAGPCVLTLEEAKAVLDDAEYNSDPKAQDVGPYGMPLGVFNAYRALARQAAKAIASAHVGASTFVAPRRGRLLLPVGGVAA